MKSKSGNMHKFTSSRRRRNARLQIRQEQRRRAAAWDEYLSKSAGRAVSEMSRNCSFLWFKKSSA